MPPRIRVLDDITANRIAAGEVVERPASVVKELLENSLDAGATRIEIDAEGGGKSLVRITDDGCGMGRDDALLCLERHATSKLRSADDLQGVTTLGFRGEALPSIASVCKFRLLTREPGNVAGTEVLVDGGKIKEVREAGCAVGTSIEVRALFHHVPGRRKFLKSDATEWAHIEQVVRLAALAHEKTGFTLRQDSREVLRLPPAGDKEERVRQLLGAGFMRDLLSLVAEEGGMKLTGWIGKPGISRSNRQDHHLFVNGRPVHSPGINFAVLEGYQQALVRGRFPVLVLFLEVPPSTLDVNVHPAKREVRFRDELRVKDFVATSIRDVLHRTGTAPASVEMEQGLHRPVEQPQPASPRARQVALFAASPLPEPPSVHSLPVETAFPSPSAPAEVGPEEKNHDLRVVGIMLGRYIMAENPQGIVLIDQEAARERILFEEIADRLSRQDPHSQRLLVAETLELSPAEAACARQQSAALESVGFGLAPLGGNTFLIDAVPASVETQHVGDFFRDVLHDLMQTGRASRSGNAHDERLAEVMARHTARLRSELSPIEVERLLADLHRCHLPYTCPGGRPTMILLSRDELKRKFGL
ncbi:MAG: DNA mismatch repair endonuclease MutL [Candidatus Methylacidiphilales bacterium]|nr:DNA mismatch repair endonuclease MutL [Candidatus Methylacidiphilales bacterium]